MKFIFSEDYGSVHERARYMRGGLLRNHHNVKVIREFSKVPNADIWFHGLSHLPEIPFPRNIQEQIEKHRGKIVFFQNDDHLQFAINKIPQHLRSRTTLYLRNTWPSDPQLIHPHIVQKRGLINPLLKPNSAKEGKNLKFRKYTLSFFGAATGGETFNRIEALQIIKNARLPFYGGIFKNPLINVDIPDNLAVHPMPFKVYMNVLENTQLSLVLHGYNPLTFRLFESLSRRCLVVAQDVSEIWFADCGLTNGVHYVAIKKDLSDLVERITYFMNHLDEAQAIADAGFQHFKKYFQFSGVNLPQPLFDEITKTWKNIDIGMGRKTPYSYLVKLALPLIHSL